MLKKMKVLLVLGLVLMMAFFGCSSGGGGNDKDEDPIIDPPPPAFLGDIRITEVYPSSAESGEEVVVYYEASESIGAAPVYLAGQEISSEKHGDKSLRFKVPAGAKSGSLHVEYEDVKSNRVFFSVSASIKKAEVFVEDDDGNNIFVDYVLVSLMADSNTRDDAEAVAARIGGEITGHLELLDAWQIQVDAKNLDELKFTVETLESYAEVDFVIVNTELPDNAATDPWYDTDPDDDGQRASNMVYEGAQEYKAKVDINNSSKITPIYTVVGIVEDHIDFDLEDFNGYSSVGVNPDNNITIYAKNGSSDSIIPALGPNKRHGSQVTGVVAAEIGEGDIDGGRQAGLLAGLGKNHGGFTIITKRAFDLREYVGSIKATEEMLSAGARVINWSWGIYQKGVKDSRGNDVTVDVLVKWIFNSQKKAFKKLMSKIESNYPNAVIVVAAGNESVYVSEDTVTPAGIVSPNMIVVGGHWPDDDMDPITRHAFSNYGERLDISACWYIKSSRDSEDVVGGTSFSAPLVTATIAAMQSINPYLGPSDIRRILRENALGVKSNVTQKDQEDSVFTAPLTAEEVNSELVGKGARLNVKGAIRGAIDHLYGRDVEIGDPIDVELGFNEKKTVKIEISVPEGKIFNSVDVMFTVDLSGSYYDDLAQFKSKSIDLINAFKTVGKNVRVGLATFVDFPIYPYGDSKDYAYEVEVKLTEEYDNVIDAIKNLKIYDGYDGPESQLEALYQLATGAGRTVEGDANASFPSMPAGWNVSSLPIVFLATDASFHDRDKEPEYPGAGWNDTVNALKSRGIKVYGLQAGGTESDVEKICSDTGGEAFVLSSDSSEIVEKVLEALGSVAESVDVTLEPFGDYFELVDSISPADGYKDVKPGENLEFEIIFHRGIFDGDKEVTLSFRLQAVAEGVAVITDIPVTINLK